MAEFYYRYQDHEQYHFGGYDEHGTWIGVEIACKRLRVLRRTHRGAWIETGYKQEKFILDGARRRWAYPTKEEALNSFKCRKQSQIWHAKRAFRNARAALKQIETMEATCDLPHAHLPRPAHRPDQGLPL